VHVVRINTVPVIRVAVVVRYPLMVICITISYPIRALWRLSSNATMHAAPVYCVLVVSWHSVGVIWVDVFLAQAYYVIFLPPPPLRCIERTVQDTIIPITMDVTEYQQQQQHVFLLD
jgi:hypothetical protein